MSLPTLNVVRPATEADVVREVQRAERIVVMGAGTKPGARHRETANATVLDLSAISGILEYEPSEFTLTARAGTPLAVIEAALAENGQSLPFDPPLVQQGATLGGTLASGFSGPGRVRYGGPRDFVLGLRFLDGNGTLIRGGGKVVKNAAGFDFPKLFVGSCGELGPVLEWTVKVFPSPRSKRSVVFAYSDATPAIEGIIKLMSKSLDLDAVDLRPGAAGIELRIRFAGEDQAIDRHIVTIEKLLERAASEIDVQATGWDELMSLNWSGADSTLVRVPTATTRLSELLKIAHDVAGDWRVTGAGQIAWCAIPDRGFEDFVQRIAAGGWTGLVVRSSVTATRSGRVGRPISSLFLSRIRQALDPVGRYTEAAR